uniref:Uncharacterized protein n=1 Tax=Timema tahoe TaxID=61484 RepID=A0A7R9IF21_9NEOP|nr:unnamed protein product [Timema tahoe]
MQPTPHGVYLQHDPASAPAHDAALVQSGGGAPVLEQMNNHRNISDLLDNLLRGYDNSVRPNFGGKYYNSTVSGITRPLSVVSLEHYQWYH